MNLVKNQIIELNIDSVTSQGSGVGRTEDKIAVFVPQSAVGDRLRVKIVKVKKTYAFGKIESVISSSKDRIAVDCPVFNKCGGCVYRHINYDAEKAVKEQTVKDAVVRIGGQDSAKVKPLISSGKRLRYRNKAQLPVGLNDCGKTVAGFFAPHSHRIIPCADCLLQPELFGRAAEIVLKFLDETNQLPYNETTGKGKLRHIYLRYGEKTNQLMVCLVVNGNGLKQENRLIERLKNNLPNLETVVINSNRKDTNVVLGEKNRVAYGKGYIEDILCGLRFKISPMSFYQVNRATAELLYGKAKEYASLKKNEVLLDLYCGTGTIGLTMAKDCKQLIGVEAVKQAVEDAEINAGINGIDNARFICADAAKAAAELEEDGIKPDAVVVDPPRKGLEKELVETIARMNPQRVVYVSCDPATLARDLKIFEENGYQTREITPVDMFPGTHHVETVVQLVRKKPDTYIDITVDMDELDLTSSEAKATYDEIKDYIFDKHRVKVSSLYVAQVKQKHGIIERDCYNNSKKDNPKQPQCPPEKVKLIEEALRHFKMIP